jgi:hypothetical protein
MVGQ